MQVHHILVLLSNGLVSLLIPHLPIWMWHIPRVMIRYKLKEVVTGGSCLLFLLFQSTWSLLPLLCNYGNCVILGICSCGVWHCTQASGSCHGNLQPLTIFHPLCVTEFLHSGLDSVCWDEISVFLRPPQPFVLGLPNYSKRECQLHMYDAIDSSSCVCVSANKMKVKWRATSQTPTLFSPNLQKWHRKLASTSWSISHYIQLCYLAWGIYIN